MYSEETRTSTMYDTMKKSMESPKIGQNYS
jgi:hypothetical protein